MTDIRVITARTVAGLAFVIGGGATQLLLWGQPRKDWVTALKSHPFMWFIYFLAASIVGEQSLRWLKKQERTDEV
jgi:hypothetical protein